MIWGVVAVIAVGWVAGACLFLSTRAPVLTYDNDPKTRNGSPVYSRSASVACIIPARNEEYRLGALLASLKTQSLEPREILVVDDGSTDATQQVARDHGACVIVAGPTPQNWAGKTWACHTGATSTSAEVLVFLDADVRLADRALERIVTEITPAGIVSIQPYHTAPTVTEKLSALFNLQAASAVGLGPSRREWRNPSTRGRFDHGRRSRPCRDRAPCGLFGPVIAIYSRDYFRLGGHERVADSLLEDVSFGRLALDQGLTVQNFLGGELVRYRMYPEGIGALLNGWTKNLFSGASAIPRTTLALEAAWITGAVTISAHIAAIALHAGENLFALTAITAAYGAYAGLLRVTLPAHGSFGAGTALLFPLHVAIYAVVFVRALLFRFANRPLAWRGRAVTSTQARTRKLRKLRKRAGNNRV